MRDFADAGSRAELGKSTEPPNWALVWQVVDSAFPTGGFAHSAGLEAAVQQGEVRSAADFKNFLIESIWQCGYGAMPIANTSYDDVQEFSRLDELTDLFLNNSVANRASRQQGRTFLATCAQAFGPDCKSSGDAMKAQSSFLHYAPVFGAMARTLRMDRTSMQRLLLFTTLRGVLSAAVRLGTVGSYEAQRLQFRFAPRLEQVIEACASLTAEDLAQTAPLLDLFQINHDRLYSRLFQS